QSRVLARLGVFEQLDLGAALGEAGHAAVALEAERVALRRNQVLLLHPALEARLHRPHCREHADAVQAVPLVGDELATGNRGAQDLGVEQRRPHLVARHRKQLLSGQFHRTKALESSVAAAYSGGRSAGRLVCQRNGRISIVAERPPISKGSAATMARTAASFSASISIRPPQGLPSASSTGPPRRTCAANRFMYSRCAGRVAARIASASPSLRSRR